MGIIGSFLPLGRNISFSGFMHNVAGIAALELALLAPFLALAILGLADTGLAVAQKMRLNDAVQQGAQYGLVRNPIQGDVSGIVAAMGPGEPNANRVIDVELFCECVAGTAVACTATCPGGGQRHRYLDVTATEDYHTLFSYPVIGSTISLRSNAMVRLQ